MKDSAAKRTTDSKVLTEQSAAKADIESDLESHTDAKSGWSGGVISMIKMLIGDLDKEITDA